jgi:hypothetical protein
MVISLEERRAARETEKVFHMIDALGAELQRQGVAEVLTVSGFDLAALAGVALRTNADKR